MTDIHAHDSPRKMGRTKLWNERMHVTLPEGAKARIDAVLNKDEDRLEFVRTAIEREIERRTDPDKND